MVLTPSDTSLQVTGILDWDEAIFAPKFRNCQPPRWLWDDDRQNAVDMDNYETPGANMTLADPGQVELKCMFEENAGSEYCRLAYEPQYRWLRGLFKVAHEGSMSSETWHISEKVMEEWALRRESFKKVD